MKAKPILFSGDMVRAILEDRKTQTRRVIKPQPYGLCADVPSVVTGHFLNSELGWRFEDSAGRRSHDELRCLYGVIGDRLWVRETFVFEWWEDEPKPPTDRPLHHHKGDGTEWDEPYWLWPHYRATDPTPELCYEEDTSEPKCKWRPSIFMPRWASRITLEITDVRVERLQDIAKDENVEDIFEEGLPKHAYYEFDADNEPSDINVEEALEDYKELWNKLNAKRGFGWDINPWVWVIEFKKVEK